MEKKQYDLCLEILRRFDQAGLLNDLILIGSWCVYFYEDYFTGKTRIDHASLKTRDIDFLIRNPSGFKQKIDIPDLLKDLGFIVDFKGSKGYIQLNHPDMILEFLVQEKGRGLDKPYPLPQLGVNATALRFLNFLSEHIIKVKVGDLVLNVPHPACFAVHKLIIAGRRTKREKAVKDQSTARAILKVLLAEGEGRAVRNIFLSTPKTWQGKILKSLDPIVDEDILLILK